MTAAQLDALCQAALKRLDNFIARCAGEQMRRMRETWKARQP